MMAPDFLTQIRASGLSVKLDGDRLQVWPGSRLTPELSETIRTHKPDIVEALGVASWCWWLAFSESEHLITYHHPSASRAEVLEKYPRALVAEPFEPPRQIGDSELMAVLDKEWGAI